MHKLNQIFNFIYFHPLARKHRLEAFYRFFRWQISQFLFPREVTVPFIGNTKLVAKKGLNGVTGNIYTGLEDFSDMSFLLHFLRKDDLFADIGANVGSYSILAAGWNGAKTISFEPVPSSFSILEKNIEINRLNEIIKAKNIGLGSKQDALFFTSLHGTVNHVIPADKEIDQTNSIQVQVNAFDEIASEEGVPQLIKIDVEGFETEVLKGMRQTLQSNSLKAIIIELNGSGGRYGYDEHKIHEDLLNSQFSPYQYNPFRRELQQLDNYGSHNTIYIKDLDFVENRIKTAEKFRVFSRAI